MRPTAVGWAGILRLGRLSQTPPPSRNARTATTKRMSRMAPTITPPAPPPGKSSARDADRNRKSAGSRARPIGLGQSNNR